MNARLQLLVVVLMACRPPAHRDSGADGAPPRESASAPRPATPPAAYPAGASCAGRGDCPAEQVCVERRCRYRRSSAEGEILLAAARAQWEAGDPRGARETYARARDAFTRRSVPAPPALLCGGALAALSCRDSPRDRERGAREAALCLRQSLPGDPHRQAVLEALAARRHDGLILSAFDEPRAERFFGEQRSRPPSDAVVVELVLPPASEPGLDHVRRALEGDEARHAARECFLRAWEGRHGREARAQLLAELTTEPRELRDRPFYLSRVRIVPTGGEDESFEACLGRELTRLIHEGPRLSRATIWQLPFEVHGRLR